MFTTINAQQLSVRSVYKLWLIGMIFSLAPLGVIFGILALFGLDTVTWNAQPIHGPTGLLVGPLIAVVLAVFLSGLPGSAAAFGLWLYSRLRPISLAVKILA